MVVQSTANVGEETLDSLVEMGIRARQNKEDMKWILGEIACRLETHHGQHSLKEYAKAIGEEPSTLNRYRWVTRMYPEEAHRRTNLSFTHHLLVATREDRLELLERAEFLGWSSKQLKEEISAGKNSGRDRGDSPLESLNRQAPDSLTRLKNLIRALMEGIESETLTIDDCRALRDFCTEVREFAVATELRAQQRLSQALPFSSEEKFSLEPSPESGDQREEPPNGKAGGLLGNYPMSSPTR